MDYETGKKLEEHEIHIEKIYQILKEKGLLDEKKKDQ